MIDGRPGEDAGGRPHGRGTARWGLGQAFAVLAIKFAADLLVGAVLLATWGRDAGAAAISLVSAAGWVPVLALLHVASRRTHDHPLIRWRGERPYRVGLVVAAGGITIALSLLLAWLAGDVSTPFEDAIRTPLDRLGVALFALAWAPLVEELFFRGYLYKALENALGGWLAVLAVGLVFGLFHGFQYAGVPAALAAVTLMGLVTSWVRMYTGALLPCVLLHLAYNVVGVGVLLLGS